MRPLLVLLLVAIAFARAAPALDVETLHAIGGLPAHLAGSFLKPLAFQQADDGTDYVFDRRAHAVYTVAPGSESAQKIVTIGAEPGRILDPSAFDLDPSDGSFVVADAPGRRERIQIFNATGSRLGGFLLPERRAPRLLLDGTVLNGIGSVQYTGRSLLVNEPESGALIAEYRFDGSLVRSFGTRRATGQEADRQVHLALNAGLPLVNPLGGFYFVFQAGIPLFRKYDAQGHVLFERHIEGAEIDDYLRTLPTTWPRQKNESGDVVPLVPPAIRTAAVDRDGNLWISLTAPTTYVYDPAGDKIRTIRFEAAGLIAPASLFFTKDARVLVTPGCYIFKTR